MNYYEKLNEFYCADVPAYIVKAGKSFIVIKLNDWQGEQELKIKIGDVINYYATQANNIVSGCRTLAGYIGDWRPVDGLAKEALEWFKFVSIEALRKQSKKQGLTPKF